MYLILCLILFFLVLCTLVSGTTVIQITDLHVRTKEVQDVLNLKAFNNSILPVIDPDYVVVSGDLVLGYRWKFVSASQKQQWELYENMWKDQKVLDKKYWLDIPGNHDYSMDEISYKENKQFDISRYSASQWNNMFSILPIRERDSPTLCLIGIDFSYHPHMPYWLHLSGYASSSLLKSLQNHLNENQCNKSIAYGHFPIAVLNSHTVSSFFIQNHISLYLSGHLHNSYGESFHIPYGDKLMDLELPSLAYNGLFRILNIQDGWTVYEDFHIQEIEKGPLIMKVFPPDYDVNMEYSVEEWKTYLLSNPIIKFCIYNTDDQFISILRTRVNTQYLSVINEEEESSSLSCYTYRWYILPTELFAKNHRLFIHVEFSDKNGTHSIDKIYDLNYSQPIPSIQSSNQQSLFYMKLFQSYLPHLLLFLSPFIILALSRYLSSFTSYTLSPFQLYFWLLVLGPSLMGYSQSYWFIACSWGTLSYSSGNGFSYEYWNEISVWNCLILLGIAFPIYFVVFLQLIFNRIKSIRKRRYINYIKRLLKLLAIVFTVIQDLLVLLNFPFSILLFSFNIVYLPILMLYSTNRWYRKIMINPMYFAV